MPALKQITDDQIESLELYHHRYVLPPQKRTQENWPRSQPVIRIQYINVADNHMRTTDKAYCFSF